MLYDYIELKQVDYKGYQARLYDLNFMLTHGFGGERFQINLGVGGLFGAGTVRLETTRVDYYHYDENYIVGGKGIFDISYQLNNKFNAGLINSIFSVVTFSGDYYILYGVQLGLIYKF